MKLSHFLKRILPIYLIIGAAIAVFYGCHRRGFEGDPHKMADHMVKMMTKKLNLSSTQSGQVQQIANEIADTLAARHQQHQPGWQPEIIKQLRATAVDTAALSQAMAQRRANAEELHDFMLTKFVQIHDILTPAQRDTLAAFLEKRGQRFWGQGGHHPSHHSGAYDHSGDTAQ